MAQMTIRWIVEGSVEDLDLVTESLAYTDIAELLRSNVIEFTVRMGMGNNIKEGDLTLKGEWTSQIIE